jgi:hypothetical protein
MEEKKVCCVGRRSLKAVITFDCRSDSFTR